MLGNKASQSFTFIGVKRWSPPETDQKYTKSTQSTAYPDSSTSQVYTLIRHIKETFFRQGLKEKIDITLER